MILLLQITYGIPQNDHHWLVPLYDWTFDADPSKVYIFWKLNPLTPVPPVTSHDEPWPFFRFWHHHFWPKFASSILNFCWRKRSFQWCPDQSDRPNGAWDMHKNAQKVERKTQTKISCHYTWLLHGKNCRSQWCFLRSFLATS